MTKNRKSNKTRKSRKTKRICRRRKTIGGYGCNKMTGGDSAPYPLNSYGGDPNNPSMITGGRNVPQIGGNHRSRRNIRKMRGGGIFDIFNLPNNAINNFGKTDGALPNAQLLTGKESTLPSNIFSVKLDKFSNFV